MHSHPALLTTALDKANWTVNAVDSNHTDLLIDGDLFHPDGLYFRHDPGLDLAYEWVEIDFHEVLAVIEVVAFPVRKARTRAFKMTASVGNTAVDAGSHDGSVVFTGNDFCAVFNGAAVYHSYRMTCNGPMEGRFVQLQVLRDTGNGHNIEFEEVDVLVKRPNPKGG